MGKLAKRKLRLARTLTVCFCVLFSVVFAQPGHAAAPLIQDGNTAVAENAVNFATVYDINDANTNNDTDPDGDAITYTIIAGNTEGIFDIDNNTGLIVVVDNTKFDRETTDQYILTVQATDGTLTSTADITIDVTKPAVLKLHVVEGAAYLYKLVTIVVIVDPGDTQFSASEEVARALVLEVNKSIQDIGGKPATFRELIDRRELLCEPKTKVQSCFVSTGEVQTQEGVPPEVQQFIDDTEEIVTQILAITPSEGDFLPDAPQQADPFSPQPFLGPEGGGQPTPEPPELPELPEPPQPPPPEPPAPSPAGGGDGDGDGEGVVVAPPPPATPSQP